MVADRSDEGVTEEINSIMLGIMSDRIHACRGPGALTGSGSAAGAAACLVVCLIASLALSLSNAAPTDIQASFLRFVHLLEGFSFSFLLRLRSLPASSFRSLTLLPYVCFLRKRNTVKYKNSLSLMSQCTHLHSLFLSSIVFLPGSRNSAILLSHRPSPSHVLPALGSAWVCVFI
mmetsp:Transcript_41069/g.81030  ORF Transcript_41069/g.81030 Transcript_41069/m.81030 type:complete len:175 (+) Transcript_41069:271-795(+)